MNEICLDLPSCSVLRLHNAQQAVVNLVKSYPSQTKRYQALTWWMEDKSWEGYPFRQSWMTLTEPCVKAHFVFACTISHLSQAPLANDIGGFPCMKLSLFIPFNKSASWYNERNTQKLRCHYDLKIQVQKYVLSLFFATTKDKCTILF